MKRRISATAALVIFCLILAVSVFWPRASSDERALSRQFTHELSALPPTEPLPLSEIEVLRDWDQVCLIDSYAVRAGAKQEESLARIFGDIDFSQFRAEIISRYTGEERPGMYLVQGGVVTASMRLFLPPHTYLQPARFEGHDRSRNYNLSSCHKPSDVCLKKGLDDAHGEHPIVVDLCENQKGI